MSRSKFNSLRGLLDGIYDVVDATEGLSRAVGNVIGRSGGVDLPIVGQPQNAVAPAGVIPELLGGDSKIPPMREATVKSIDDRIRYIMKFAQQGREDSRVREFVMKAVSSRCGDKYCASEEDNWAEIKILFNALRRRFRYTGDVYGKDTYQAPGVTLDIGGGDCDCAAALVGACYGSIGYTVYLRVIETVDSPNDDWDHIYNLVGLPRDAPTGVVPIDLAAIGQDAGWQIPERLIKRKRDWLIP